MSTSFIPEEATSPQPRGTRTSGSPKSKRWVVILLAGALVAVVLIALARKHKSASQAGESPLSTPNIRTATAHRGSIGEYIDALGTVTPLATVDLYSQVNGEVLAVHYAEGRSFIRVGS